MKLYGLIGKTLKHSFSKNYFTKKFAAEGLTDYAYENFELPDIAHIQNILTTHPNIQGLNVTIPYKEAVLPHLHQQNDIVQNIHACNCIKVVNGKLHGYNTDVIGFKQSLLQHLQPHHTRALILGTGGAAKAVQYALTQLSIEYKIVSRQGKENVITYNAIDQTLLQQYTLIINTTPVGMYPHMEEAPPLPYQYITPQHFLFDLIYNPPITQFLQLGKDKGATICNGQDMLVLQAEESWRIWNS